MPSLRTAIVALGVCAVGVLGTGGALALVHDDATGSAPGVAAPALPAVATPAVTLLGRGPDALTSYATPFVLQPTDGAIDRVSAQEDDGTELPGSVGPDGTWRSGAPLFPDTGYRLTVTLRDSSGGLRDTAVVTRTPTSDDPVVVPTVSPREGAVVGIGQPVAVRLDMRVRDRADRAEIERRLAVTTTPAVPGAWHWMDDRELHYRAQAFWAPGTTISVSADLDHLALPNGLYGSGKAASTFTVGPASTSVVDVAAHTMTVSRDGEVVRTMKASMGKPGFETRAGTFLVLEKHAVKVMDGSTLATPQDYKTTVDHAVRITNSGTFMHAAPWSVGSQGRANVSHGCVNLSPADAAWYFDQTRIGDVVEVVNSPAESNFWDAGSRDWKLGWDAWQAGSATSS